MKNNFPERLKKARIAKKLSQANLGELANLKPTIICTYEKGRRSPTIITLKKLAIILEVSSGWLMGESDKNIKTLKISPNEMILELRERIRDRLDFVDQLKDNLLTKNSLIEALKDENLRLKKDLSLTNGELLRKNG